jgi:hypothetical protein
VLLDSMQVAVIVGLLLLGALLPVHRLSIMCPLRNRAISVPCVESSLASSVIVV